MGIFGNMFGGSDATDVGDSGVKPLNSISDQSKDEIELISFVRSRVDDCRNSSARTAHEGIWMTNIAYVLGYDGVYYDTTMRQFRTVGKGGRNVKRNRIRVNKILPSLQNRLARLCKNPPRYDVRPNSSDTEDKEASRLSLSVINMVWDEQKVNKKRIDLMMWVQECGHAYLKVSYDDQLGKLLIDPMTGEMIYEGNIRVDVCSPFEIFPDPQAKTLEEAFYVVQAKVRKLDYFRTHYPEKGHLVKEEDAWLLSAQYEMRINSLNTRGQGQSGSQTVMKNSAIELAYYEKRSEKHPNGRLVVCANGVLLENKELPVGEIPFAKFDDVVIGGKYYSESTITHARPIQDQYNRVVSLRANWTNKLLAGKYMAAKGHGIIQESISDESGEIIEYDMVPQAPPPVAIQVPVIPEYAYKEEDRLQNMMYDTFGINEISRGQLPAAGIPAVGMQFLMEQDDTRIGIVTENHEHAFAKIGELIIKNAATFYQTPRLLKEVGKNNEYAIKSFVGADLRESHDVIVLRGSTLPGSKVLKRQEIINAYMNGFLGDPADPNVRMKVLETLEFGDVGEMWVDLAIDTAQIQKQLDMIEQGAVPQVSEMDNNELHIQEKNRYRKTDRFEKLTPMSQQILLSDIEQRIQILMKRANPALGAEQQSVQAELQKAPQVMNQAMQGMQPAQQFQEPQPMPQAQGGM